MIMCSDQFLEKKHCFTTQVEMVETFCDNNDVSRRKQNPKVTRVYITLTNKRIKIDTKEKLHQYIRGVYDLVGYLDDGVKVEVECPDGTVF